MKVLALPRNSTNPYQELLYQEFRRRGVEVTYIGSATPSYTLNQLLLPIELVVGRLAGARLVHLHWVYVFGPNVGPLPAAQAGQPVLVRPVAMDAAPAWLRPVWTAHNILPLQPCC